MAELGRLPVRFVRGRVGVALVGVVGLVAAACGSDDGGESSAIPAEEFRERAGAACTVFFSDLFSQFLDSFDSIDPTTGEPRLDDEEALGARVIELGDEFTSELRAIGPPAAQVDAWTEWVELLDESIDEQREDPLAALGDEEASANPDRSERIDGLSQELGVPQCAEPDIEQLQIDEESAASLARLFAEGIRMESDGLIDEGEAECIADGVLDELTLSELFSFDDDSEDLPVDQQARVFDVMAECLPTEKLVQLGS